MIAVKLPDGRTINVDTDDPKAAAAAARKYMTRTPAPKREGGVMDAVKSFGSGALGSALDMAANLGSNQIGNAVAELSNAVAPGSAFAKAAIKAREMGRPANMQRNAGLLHDPQTVGGEYARTAGEMSGNAVLPGGILRRAANVAVPAIASETAGQATKGTKAEGVARVAGGLLGGVAAGAGVRRKAASYATEAAPKVADKALRYAAKQVDTKKLTPSAKPRMAAESSQRGITAVGALARRPGKTGEKVAGMLSERSAEMPNRIMDDIAHASGIRPEAARGDIQGVVDAGRQAAGPLYAEAYATPMQATPRLMELAQMDVVKSALDDAYRLAKADPSLDPKLLEEFNNPQSTRLWDYAKRALDDQVRALYENGVPKKPAEARIMTDLSQALTAELKVANPKFGEALDVAGEYLSAQAAFKAGSKALTDGKVPAAKVAEDLARLTPAERQAYIGGMTNRAFDMAQSARLGPRAISLPHIQGKFAAALGEEKAGQLFASIGEEGAMQANANRMIPGGGSGTMPWNEAAREQDIAFGGGLLSDYASNMTQGRGVIGSATTTLGQKLRGLLDDFNTSRSEPVRDEAGRLLTMPPEELQAILQQARQNPQLMTPDVLARLGLTGLLAANSPTQ